MKVSLKVLSHNQQPPDLPLQASFDETGGTIGRAAGNDWLLPDSKRFLSSRHARIHFADGQFALTDLSANGVYVNGALEPIGKGRTVSLDDGDRLALGEYDIEVTIPAAGAPIIETAAPGRELAGGAPVPRPGAPTPMAPYLPDGERLLAPSTAAGPIDGEAVVSPLDLYPGARPVPDPDPPPPSVLERGSSPEREAVAPGLGGLPADWDRTSMPAGWPSASPADVAEAGAAANAPAPLGPAGSRRTSGPGGLGDYLAGARVDDPRAHDGEPAATLRQAGALSHAAVAALTELLRARSELKETVRTNRTLPWQANNPLKNLALSTPDTVARLLRPDVDAEALVGEVAHDLKSHELAMLAGLQASLRALLDRLDPEHFDAGTGGRGVIGAGRKGKAWDAYCAAHAALTESMEDGMVQLLRSEFARAYEEEVRNLRRDTRPPDVAHSVTAEPS